MTAPPRASCRGGVFLREQERVVPRRAIVGWVSEQNRETTMRRLAILMFFALVAEGLPGRATAGVVTYDIGRGLPWEMGDIVSWLPVSSRPSFPIAF